MDLKILFPAPPPTSNTLTPSQRVQLLRTTTKLGRLLGATPHFVDQAGLDRHIAPLHLDLPLHHSAHPRKNSVDSISSSSSSSSSPTSTPPSSPASSLSSYSSSAPSSLRSHFCSQSKPSSPPDTWRPHHRRSPPLLRLALQSSPTLETIPASPSSPSPTHPHVHSSYTLTPKSPHTIASPSIPTPTSSAAPTPTFRIPSSANTSIRRAKMDRVRRTLGEGVPLRLVFPPTEPHSEALTISNPHSEASISNRHPSTPIHELAEEPRAWAAVGIQHQPKREHFVVHHRQSTPYAQAPGPARVRGASGGASGGTPSKGRALCMIVESPDEHGAGCSEEFGFVGSGFASEDGPSAFVTSGSLRRRRGIDFGRALGLGEKRGRRGVMVN